jgi:NADPH:quinone reductase-like Zn-dependent oxidoreductase
MRAARYESYGASDVIHVEEIETPTPADDELLVQVRAATVSRTDCAILAAHPFFMRMFTGLWVPRRRTLGTDFAGRVEAVGARVTKYAVGDLVWGFEELGANSHAEHLVIAEGAGVARMPPELDFKDAAACLEGAFYAWSFLNKVEVGAGVHVMINGATGAIGAALLQLCVDAGAIVTAVGDTKNLDRLRSLRAARVIDYLKDDFTHDTAIYDYVFDAVGKSTFGRCRRLLRPGGVYMSSELGPGWQNLVLPMITRLSGQKRVIFPIPEDKPGFLAHMHELARSGRFHSVIDRTFRLDSIHEAYAYAASGQKTGCVILDVGG